MCYGFLGFRHKGNAEPPPNDSAVSQKGNVMTTNAELAKMVKEMEAKMSEQSANIDKLAQIVTAVVTAQQTTAKTAKPAAPAKPWLSPCAEYATPAQKVEYDKLASKAKAQLSAAKKLFGTESVTCFIPIPKTADRMPHSLRWSATYAKNGESNV